jgi:hypothetical protein
MSVNIGAVVPDGAKIKSAIVKINTAFNGTAPTLKLGVTGALDSIATEDEIDMASAGIYDIDCFKKVTGDTQAMDKVVEHCEFDTLILRDVWPHLAPYVKKFTLPLAEWHHVIHAIPSRRREAAHRAPRACPFAPKPVRLLLLLSQLPLLTKVHIDSLLLGGRLILLRATI